MTAHEFDLLDRTWSDITPPAARRMLVAAAAAFAGRGYHATTTRDIAAQAGMSPAAVYIHYRSKEDLLFQISRIGHTASLDVLTSAATSAATPATTPAAGSAASLTSPEPDPAARMAAAVSAFASWHAEHHTTARVVQYELNALTPEHFAEVVVLRRRIEDTVRRMIEDGVAAGVFHVLDARGATLAVLSLCIDVARWYQPGGRRSPADIGALYADLVLRMLGT
ncbi:TetR/AcrR family transcriptional regulator [Actinosynnema sp. NPDC047251]|uniref:Transcriptional regulator, TetR family n=1 Tax=Saccharothrix espanaensis (strain ATCC 51144 / DSM 44229 / JCM 9112 / NBRC 15066 / NRRL 15764) TaxID=1179773 RepID=K0JYF7_SACES|nr:TetR/AcrR family transcriptional regulator [Saccharothrix espanaensis]CCH29248.1 Transcriptional regulator, TetR family [Saccharothrix espanaensis DSM 44229]